MSRARLAPFPYSRPRRLRQAAWIRDLARETRLGPQDLIWPIFIREGQDGEEPVEAMPGVSRLTVDRAVEAAKRAHDLGIPCLALFPYTDPSVKTPGAEEAWNPGNLVNTATRAIKSAVPEIGVLLDVALDPYNSDGHDGIVEDGRILNDATLLALEENDHPDVMVMSYAAKYASAYYGPFRDAVGASGALKGDKKTYQMDYGNSDEALREVAADLEEGADMVMVKPGLPYLDICQRVKAAFEVPTYAYQVSGEYAMIAGAIERGWLAREAVILESLGAFRRAGCDGILTYFAPEAAELLA
jgi:porphobilinogen synthase